MATYVNDLRLKEIATGDESGTWGTSTNTNLELIGESMGYGTEAVANASTHTITMADGATDGFRCTFLRLTGGGQACTVTLAPNTLSHTWIIRNTTSYALTFTQGSGANVIIAAGQAKIVTTDGLGAGAVVYECLEDLELGGTITVGIDDAGYDVKLYGATSGKSLLWDESADSLIVTGSTSQQGTLTVGVDDTGYDVKLFGATSGKYWLWDESADGVVQQGTLTVGVDDTGFDVKLFGATSGKYWLWDESADGVVQQGTLTVGVDDTGFDVKLFGATSGNYMLWDESADSLLVNGDIDMVTNGNRIDLDTDNDTSIRASADDTITFEVGGSDLIALTTTSTFSCPVTVGVDDTGHDVKLFGATSGNYMLWDESADSLLVNGDIDMVTNGNRIDLDTDNDTSIRASADDTITVEVGGSDLIALTTTSTFSCPVTVGVDDTGHDVNLFGATSGKSLLWDESADSLIVTGTTSLDGAVTINDNSADVDTRIESNGNANMFFVDGGNDRIGIGTATPDYTVELEGVGSDHVTPTLALTNSQAGGYGSSLVFVSERSDDNSHNVAARIQTQGAAAWNSDANTGSSLIFSTVRADTLTEACRMTTEGDFYIAATAVQGAGGCTFDVESRGVNQTFNQSSHADNNEFITFRNSGTQIGSITAPNSSTTAYNTSSDYRLKENVDYSWDATTRLKQLKPARFNWIADSSNTLQDGFLAHEVSSIVPESVGGDKDATETYTDDNGDEQTRIKPQQMDLAKLVPLLVKTIQELEARIAALEA